MYWFYRATRLRCIVVLMFNVKVVNHDVLSIIFIVYNHSSSIIFFLCMTSNTVSYASGSDLWRQLIWGGGGNAKYKTLKCPLAELSLKLYHKENIRYSVDCVFLQIFFQGKLFHSKALIITNVEILSGSDWWLSPIYLRWGRECYR